MTDGENNRNVAGTTINAEATKIKNKNIDIYTIAFSSDAKRLEDSVGTANIKKAFTAIDAPNLYAAFNEIADEITNLPKVEKVTNAAGEIDLSEYVNKDITSVIIYKGENTTLKTYTGAEFKAILTNGKFDLAKFINVTVAGAVSEKDTINIKIVTSK